MSILIVLLILFIVFGGGFGYSQGWHERAPYGGYGYGGGLGTILIILFVAWLVTGGSF